MARGIAHVKSRAAGDAGDARTDGKPVYDVFARKRECPKTSPDPVIEADLRTVPARLYAILPATIEQVALAGPQAVAAGQAFSWRVAVQDAQGNTLAASLPVRVRLLAADGTVWEEKFLASAADGLRGTSWMPWNAAGTATLEATELVTGKVATLAMAVPPAATPASFAGAATAPTAASPGHAATGKAGSPSSLPAETKFGPHLKAIALLGDGTTAVVNAMNWDHNLYALDLKSGEVKWRQRIGQHFAYDSAGGRCRMRGAGIRFLVGRRLPPAPARLRRHGGTAIRALRRTQTGHELVYREIAARPDQQLRRRPQRHLGGQCRRPRAGRLGSRRQGSLERRLVADDPPASPTDRPGRRHAGPAVRHDRHRPSAQTGETLWEQKLAETGRLQGGAASGDRRTLAVRSDTDGGRVYLLRDGRLLRTFMTPADDLALTPDGSGLAVVTGRELKWFAADRGLVWNVAGDDVLRGPRIAADGLRVAVGSELGTLYVFDRVGQRLHESDVGALPAVAWLPDGDLLVASWMGSVARLDAEYRPRWQRRIAPVELDVRPKLLAADTTPTVRRTWGNAAGKPAELVPNLLKTTAALIEAYSDPVAHAEPQAWQNPVEMLRDGQPEVAEKPWLPWADINYIDSGWRQKWTLQFDTFRTQIRLTGITFVEDARHPESWLRDMRLQAWDATQEQWQDGPYLLSNEPLHTHWFAQPIEAAKFRLVTSGGGTWPAGNLRLGEIVFHGEVLGASHPDVVARRPVAVLFDEQENDLAPGKVMMSDTGGRPYKMLFEGAFSGGKCLALTAAGQTAPHLAPAVWPRGAELGFRDRRGSAAGPVSLAAICVEGPVARIRRGSHSA